jgi:hypothetical protein
MNKIAKTGPNLKNFDELESPEVDSAQEPPYYRLPCGASAWDVMAEIGVLDAFLLGNAIKYALRAGRKPGESAEKDLAKARHCLDKMMREAKK